jgi:hypothetical protein
MRTLVVFALSVGLALAAVPAARACGQCKEDKIAATYDHAVVTAARKKGQTVVFAELRGAGGPTSRADAWIRGQAEATAGVARGTVRVSLEPAALSFVCERQAVTTVLRALEQKLSRRGMGVTLLEAQASPVARVPARPSSR